MRGWVRPDDELPEEGDKVLFVTRYGMRAFGTFVSGEDARTVSLVQNDNLSFYFQPTNKGAAIPPNDVAYWLKVEPIPADDVNWYK